MFPTPKPTALALAGLFLVALPLQTQAEDEKFVAVHAGKLIVGNGEEMENVTVLIRDGKVDVVGENVELPFPCEEIDARDATVMPGLIHPASRLGLLSFNRSGNQAQRTVAEEFMVDAEAFEDAREQGFTTIALEPPGSAGVNGRAMVVRTADVGGGWIVADDSYIKLNLRRPGADRKLIRGALQQAKKDIEARKKAKEEWEKKKQAAEEAAKKKAAEDAKKNEAEKKKEGGKAYEEPPKPEKKAEAPKAPEFKPPAIKPTSQPFVDLLEKKDGRFAMVNLGGGSTYLHFLEAVKDFEIAHVLRATTRGGRFSADDLFLVADQLGENEELVIMFPVIGTFPYTINPLNSATKMIDAGARVAFCPTSDGRSGLEAVRFQVANLIGAGLSREDATKGLGVHAAEAVGLGARLGSVEKGKDGNLLILSGDPFDVQTKVRQVVLEGSVIYDGLK